jgi:hypothetical protein
MPILNAAAGAAAAAAAAEMQRREEEEEMTPYAADDLQGYEFKIIRSATGMFKHPAKLREVLEEEARAGWELVEKFDNGRVRLKREIAWRQKDATLTQDPYRITVGVSEAKLGLWIVLGTLGGLGLVALVIAAIAKGT